MHHRTHERPLADVARKAKGAELISRVRFAHLPTAVEELPRLSAVLGGPRILVKRDDQTGLAFGGNKTRKLEFLVAEAKDQGADTLVSAGAVQSNHCRQTAAAAAKFGFGCILVLTGEDPKQASANYLLDGMLGARIVHVADRADRDRVLEGDICQRVGGRAAPVLGAIRRIEPRPECWATPSRWTSCSSRIVAADWIVFATSSGGTHAGLVLGQRKFGFRGKILGISIDESVDWIKTTVSHLATEASERMGERIEFGEADVLANDEYCRRRLRRRHGAGTRSRAAIRYERRPAARSGLHGACGGRPARLDSKGQLQAGRDGAVLAHRRSTGALCGRIRRTCFVTERSRPPAGAT